MRLCAGEPTHGRAQVNTILDLVSSDEEPELPVEAVEATLPRAQPVFRAKSDDGLSAELLKARAAANNAQQATDTTISFSLQKLRRQWHRADDDVPRVSGTDDVVRETLYDLPLDQAGLQGGQVEAEQALSRVVSKADFGEMQVVGQFNHAFIIARRRIAGAGTDQTNLVTHDDLFIVDQHASDEKYNYEDLQRTTVIQSQRLLKCVYIR